MSLLIHAIAAIALFFFTNWIGKNSLHLGYAELSFNQPFNDSPAFNLTYRVFAPVACITILAAIFYFIGLDTYVVDIYRIVVFYFLFRFLFNVVTDRLLIVSHIQFFFIAALSIACSMVAYDLIISKKEFFFPSASEIGSALWLGVVAFLYQTLNSISTNDSAQQKRINRYILEQYKKFNHRYWRVVDEAAGDLDTDLIYSVMIFESLNRPRVYGPFESAKVRLCGKASVGPMQVTTRSPLNEIDSIRRGVEILKDSYSKHATNPDSDPDSVINLVFYDYNPSPAYAWEVSKVLEILKERKGEV